MSDTDRTRSADYGCVAGHQHRTFLAAAACDEEGGTIAPPPTQDADTARPIYDPDEYPEGHSPFCHRDCEHPCHDAYDQAVRLLDSPLYDVVDHVEPLGTAISYEGEIEVVGDLNDGSPCLECNGRGVIADPWDEHVDRCPACTTGDHSDGHE